MKSLMIGWLCLMTWFSAAQTSVENFSLSNVADGAVVSLNDFSSMDGVVILFTSNVCPYDVYYRARISSLIDACQGKVQVLLLNSHLEPDESEEKMKAAYATWGLTVPYLSDKGQAVMKMLGARKSPEAFLLKRANGKFILFYSGAIDDNAQMANAVGQSYLKTAIDRMLAGQPAGVAATRTVGCTIRGK